jgi:hypothetical protein
MTRGAPRGNKYTGLLRTPVLSAARRPSQLPVSTGAATLWVTHRTEKTMREASHKKRKTTETTEEDLLKVTQPDTMRVDAFSLRKVQFVLCTFIKLHTSE